MLIQIPKRLFWIVLKFFCPVILNIINESLNSGIVPKSLKCAAIKPLMKKPGFYPHLSKHYIPVSTLLYISKLLERVVAAQLVEHFA